MPNIFIVKNVLFFLGLFGFSVFICQIIIRNSQIMDIPNIRSSHTSPTATIGGLAIVFTFFLGMGILYFFNDETLITSKFFIGFSFASILIASMSLYDDYKQKPAYFKLITQIIAILVVMTFGILITSIDYHFLRINTLGIVSYLITFIWILGLTNAYNFMDGLNGMAGGNAVIAAGFFCVISFSRGSNFTFYVCNTIIAGTAGFLIFNFPKGKLFMGDVGSTFLGFTFATLAITSSLYDNSHTSLLVIPLLLFHFIYDTLFTFIRRLLAKENVFQAHRTHLYQLFNQFGYSHTTVTSFYCLVAFVQGLGACWMAKISGQRRILIFIPFIIFQLIYSITIMYYAKKKGLIKTRW